MRFLAVCLFNSKYSSTFQHEKFKEYKQLLRNNLHKRNSFDLRHETTEKLLTELIEESNDDS